MLSCSLTHPDLESSVSSEEEGCRGRTRAQPGLEGIVWRPWPLGEVTVKLEWSQPGSGHSSAEGRQP